jgi:2-oxoacid:acceptor oxidoreductase delta subunit (pyruvate/2-ketoisovalerate family)
VAGVRGIPPVSVSQTTTLVTRTGSWKYIRPAYHDRVAPCNQGCPVGIDIEGYMNLLREGRIAEARELLLAENPMPAVTGRVCHHPCENACNRRQFDGAVSIHAVERMLGDFEREGPAAVAPASARKERVAVVGSGPAGLACAYHLARFGYRVTVFEAAAKPGGMLRLGIPEYRLPRRILDRDIERIVAQGVEIRCGTRVGIEPGWQRLLGEYDAVFVASGAQTSHALGIAGEDARGVRPGLEFLREVNEGGRPDVGRHVVVIGGGNTAMDCARSALRLGASVTVLYRRTRGEMPAIAEEIEGAQREGAVMRFLLAPIAFHAAAGRVRAVECQRMMLGEPDRSGRQRPVPTGERLTIPADTVLTAIGETPDLDGLPDDVTREASGVRVNSFGQSSRATLFAGGDVTDAARTVADALGAGKRAAVGIDRHFRKVMHGQLGAEDADGLRFGGGNLSAVRWLGGDPINRVAPVNEVVAFEEMNLNHFAAVPRRPDTHIASEIARDGFGEVNLGLTDREAMEEARRCLNCGVCTQCDLCLIFCPDAAITRNGDGAYAIALDYCKGCGVCAAECPRGAIGMTREGL